MKLRFNGVIEKRSKGCVPCGGGKSDRSFSSSRMYILPSGITKTFRVGKVEEVSREDAEFLLSYTFTDADGRQRQVFDVWE